MKPDERGGSLREIEAKEWAQAMRSVAQGENARRMAAAAKRRADDEARREEVARIEVAKAAERESEMVACHEAEVAVRKGLGGVSHSGWLVEVAKAGSQLAATLSVPYINFYLDKHQRYYATGAEPGALCIALKQALADNPPAHSSPQWEQCRADKFAGSPPAYFFGRLAPRITHCADCKHALDSRVHPECGACHGIICPRCVCCGCRINTWQYYGADRM